MLKLKNVTLNNEYILEELKEKRISYSFKINVKKYAKAIYDKNNIGHFGLAIHVIHILLQLEDTLIQQFIVY